MGAEVPMILLAAQRGHALRVGCSGLRNEFENVKVRVGAPLKTVSNRAQLQPNVNPPIIPVVIIDIDVYILHKFAQGR
jgi:hypothetical protein